MSQQRVIVSRHPAAIEFIRRELPDFSDAPVVESATSFDVKGKEVAGNLPLHLAALAKSIWAVEFVGTPPRGQEYGLAEMDAAGAYVHPYRVVDKAVLVTQPKPATHSPRL